MTFVAFLKRNLTVHVEGNNCFVSIPWGCGRNLSYDVLILDGKTAYETGFARPLCGFASYAHGRRSDILSRKPVQTQDGRHKHVDAFVALPLP